MWLHFKKNGNISSSLRPENQQDGGSPDRKNLATRWEGLVRRTGKISQGCGRDGRRRSHLATKIRACNVVYAGELMILGLRTSMKPPWRILACLRQSRAWSESSLTRWVARKALAGLTDWRRRRRRRPFRFHRRFSDLSSASVDAMENRRTPSPLAGSLIPSPRRGCGGMAEDWEG